MHAHQLTVGNERSWFRVCARLLVVSVLLSTVAPVDTYAQEASGSVEAGAQLFRTKGCLNCHMVGGGGLGPDLRTVESARSFNALTAAVWNHVPQMRAAMRGQGVSFEPLEVWEVSHLVAYIGWLNYFSTAGDTARGARVFRSKGCVGCHQVRGVGGVIGPNLDQHHAESPISLAAAMWNHIPAMMEARAAGQPDFSSDELQDLITFVEGGRRVMPAGAVFVVPGRAAVGQDLFREKQCVQCHQVRGIGGQIGPDLGRAYRYRTVLDFATGIWNRGPQMIAAMRGRAIDPPTLSAQEMADLIAFFYAGPYFDEAGDVARGRQLVRTSRCAGCHEPVEWSRLGAMTSPQEALAALWNHLALDDGGAEENARWRTLSERDAADITAYLLQGGGSR